MVVNSGASGMIRLETKRREVTLVLGFKVTFSEESTMQRKEYKTPKLVAYGPIADHTFNNPGVGDKSSNTTFETDKFGDTLTPPPRKSPVLN